ncbi:MAG: 4Fe-4S binding protein, partial [Pelovirga sp.]
MPAATSRSQARLLGPRRRGVQWFTTLLLLLLPWLQQGGRSLVRIDIPSLSLHLFGQVIRIEELYLFLLFALLFGCAFLLITLVSGRVWCGWACPQTTLSDSAEWIARTLSLTVRANRLIGSRWRILVAQLAYLLLALLVSANLIWYFIEPRRFFASLWHGEMPAAVLLTLLITALLIYLDIALVRRLLCREFCPYGRIQSSLVDAGTLTLQLPATEKPRCRYITDRFMPDKAIDVIDEAGAAQQLAAPSKRKKSIGPVDIEQVVAK